MPVDRPTESNSTPPRSSQPPTIHPPTIHPPTIRPQPIRPQPTRSQPIRPPTTPSDPDPSVPNLSSRDLSRAIPSADPDRPPPTRPRLLDQVRQTMRLRHMSHRTETAYVYWIVDFLRFHKQQTGHWQHPATLGNPDINQYLTWLAVRRNVAASTQNQALSALLFLYTRVLEREVQFDAMRAQRPVRVPVVLSVPEVQALLNAIPRPQPTDGRTPVRFRTADHGMLPNSHQGSGLRSAASHHSRRQGRKGSHGSVTRPSGRPPPATTTGSAPPTPAGHRRRGRLGLDALRL